MNFRFIEIEEPSTDDEETYNKLICKEAIKAHIKIIADEVNVATYDEIINASENAISKCIEYLCGLTSSYISFTPMMELHVGEYTEILKKSFNDYMGKIKDKITERIEEIIKYGYVENELERVMNNIQIELIRYKMNYNAYKRRFYRT